MVPNLKLLILLGVIMNTVDAANILCVLPTPARSHSRMFESLLHGLVARGHHVTYASELPLQLPLPSNISKASLKSILLNGGGLTSKDNMDVVLNPKRRPILEMWMLWKVAPILCENQLLTPEIQFLLEKKNNITFDLVMVESFFFECMLPFAYYFNASLITITTQWPLAWSHVQIGNQILPSVYPQVFLNFGDKMNFYERTYNTIFTSMMLAARQLIFLPRQDAVVRRIFGEDTPSLSQMENEVSLMFTNTDPLLNFPISKVPGIVEIGGIHIKPVQPLPEKLADYLDVASNGVILISLGSLITSENVAPERLQLLTKTMSALPYDVLWQWDTTDVPDLPKNVRIETWIPQRDVLAHPNVKLLVTHGGLLSAQEATLEGVPRLVLPFFSDQHMNAWRAVDLEIGLAINFHTAKPHQLEAAIMQLMTQPQYRENARKISQIFRDQPQSPLDRALFWTEYVLRHDGAPHLRSAAKTLAWYQLYLLDVLAAVLVTLVFVITLTRVLLRFTLSLMSDTDPKTKFTIKF